MKTWKQEVTDPAAARPTGLAKKRLLIIAAHIGAGRDNTSFHHGLLRQGTEKAPDMLSHLKRPCFRSSCDRGQRNDWNEWLFERIFIRSCPRFMHLF